MLTRVRYVGARMVQGDTCLRDCNSWCLVGTRLYAFVRVSSRTYLVSEEESSFFNLASSCALWD